jgi:hypothetical protein
MKTFEYKLQGDGRDSWLVTDGTEKFMSYISPIEVYKKEIEDYHNLMLVDLLNRKNYLSLGEVSLWVEDENYGTEATQIIEWFKSTYQTIVEHLEKIEQYQNPQTFISSLPVLN